MSLSFRWLDMEGSRTFKDFP